MSQAPLEALERQTGGNPLLLGESLRSIEARAMLHVEQEPRQWEALLPHGVEYLFDAKLRLLSADAPRFWRARRESASRSRPIRNAVYYALVPGGSLRLDLSLGIAIHRPQHGRHDS